MDKGLDVKGLDATDISRKIENYVVEHFKGFKVDTSESFFMEGHRFSHEEISGLIPDKYAHLFSDEDTFMGLDGFVIFDNKDPCSIALLLDENQERAYLLCVDEPDEQGNENMIVIGDFLA